MQTLTISRRAAILTATMLCLGTGLVTGASTWAASRAFSDVLPSHKFYESINWAQENGIVTGYTDGTFRPTNAVTRQAVAAILDRYNATISTYPSTTNPGKASAFSWGADCPAGRRPIAGGGTVDISGLVITDSYPSLGSWTVRWESKDGSILNPDVMTVWVTCLPETGGAE